MQRDLSSWPKRPDPGFRGWFRGRLEFGLVRESKCSHSHKVTKVHEEVRICLLNLKPGSIEVTWTAAFWGMANFLPRGVESSRSRMEFGDTLRNMGACFLLYPFWGRGKLKLKLKGEPLSCGPHILTHTNIQQMSQGKRKPKIKLSFSPFGGSTLVQAFLVY